MARRHCVQSEHILMCISNHSSELILSGQVKRNTASLSPLLVYSNQEEKQHGSAAQ